MRELPRARILADTRTAAGVQEFFGASVYPSAVLYSTPEWLNTHHVEAAHLVRAFERAVQWMRLRNPQEIASRMPAEFRSPSEDADIEALRGIQAMLSLDGRMPQRGAEAVRNVLDVSLEGVRTANFDVTQTYTNEFLDQP
jgi:NitT/TauT family transport system substrate-binding protein